WAGGQSGDSRIRLRYSRSNSLSNSRRLTEPRIKARASSSRGPRAGERLARLPQSFRGRVVARGGGGLGDLALDEIGAGHIGDFRRGGEIDERIGTPFGRDREHLGEREQPARPAARSVAEPGRDKARMKAVGGDCGSGEPAGEFAGEQDVGELGAPIGLPGVAPHALKIGKV